MATTLDQTFTGVDLVVLAAPPGANLVLLTDMAKRIAGGATIVTDVSSVKRPIVERAAALGALVDAEKQAASTDDDASAV